MKQRIINRLWKGYASLRDYEVEDAILEGGIILSLEGTEDVMTLFPSELKKKAIALTEQEHVSMYNRDKTYKLVDFRWKPDRNNKNQKGLDL